jgi:hypothetical protein
MLSAVAGPSEAVIVFALASVVVFGALSILSLLVAARRVRLAPRILGWVLIFACILLAVTVGLLLWNLVLP